MKQVICTNPKGYRLTQNREYTVDETQKRGYYQLTNDNGREVFYADDLFRDVPRESTADEIMNTLNIEFTLLNNNPNSVSISPSYSIDGGVMSFTSTLGYERMNASCGICDLAGINGLVSNIVNIVPNRQDLHNRMLTTIIERLINYEHLNYGLFLISTQVDNNNHIELIDSVLSNVGLVRIQKYNPNSGNQIVLWVLERDDVDDATIEADTEEAVAQV